MDFVPPKGFITFEDMAIPPSTSPSEPVRYSNGGEDMQQRAKPKPRIRSRGSEEMPTRIPYNVLQHTKMRFDTMTIKQMWTRMGKTTNPDKLRAFCLIANERGHSDLSIAAAARLARLTGDNSMLESVGIGVAKPKPKPKKKGERLLRRMDG